ncbi:MAG: undecaprenyl-phosphate glucose phosphotransferase [Kiritimatiellae bacterium]|nr:undecaprenyl-phosphate glucose phosphotransferase [Kiritimatiellia bacterium]
MHRRDRLSVAASALAALFDAAAVFTGILLATWLRFGTGFVRTLHDRLAWVRERFPLIEGPPPQHVYLGGAIIATLLFLWIFKTFGLYARPQTGTFGDKIPRLFRATGLGFLIAASLAFALKNRAPVSTPVVLLSVATVTILLLLERYALFRWELRQARNSPVASRVLVVGADSVGESLMKALQNEPRLRAEVVGFLQTDPLRQDAAVPKALIRGSMEDLPRLLQEERVERIVVADSGLSHQEMVKIIMLCERNLVTFSLVPDLFRVMTSSMDIQFINGIPLLGMQAYPLDAFANQCLKRAEDVLGALLGLILAAPVIGICALLIKKTSPGPVFYRQERCGRSGEPFTIYKLRTMRTDAEVETGPVWATEDDPRRTRIGAFLRRTNLDELPQLWNVLKGEMSLVGPRPERPHFVEQFKEDISRYMWRHVSKPGITGWAQVNGLRGNTSIQERIKHDLYYLENWSLSLDFKIMVRTLFARKNAY